MKKGLIGLLGVLAYSISALALAQGSYVGVQVGGVILQDATITEAGSPDVTASFNTGFGIGGFVGYNLPQNLRVEGEISYRQNDVDTLSAPSVAPGVALNVQGDISALSFMGNVYYDFPLSTGFKPYVGGGVGLAHVSIDNLGLQGTTLPNVTDDVFAYQVGAGVGYEVMPRTTVSLDYRYFGTSGLTFPDPTATNGATFQSGYHSHTISLRLQYDF